MSLLLRDGESVQLARTAVHDHLEPEDGSILTYVPQVGSIIPFYDFNGALTFDGTKWAYCDGSNVAVAGIGGMSTLPDLSGRVLVGFGTVGGGDIDTATWATAAIGNANHVINLAHSHIVDNHSHTVNSHTHSISSHTHTVNASGDHSHGGRTIGNSVTANEISNNYRVLDDNAGWVNANPVGNNYHLVVGGPDNDYEGMHDHNIQASGTHTHTTGSSGGGNTGAATPGTSASAPGTNSALSSSQSILPSSIRVRYLMRIA